MFDNPSIPPSQSSRLLAAVVSKLKKPAYSSAPPPQQPQPRPTDLETIRATHSTLFLEEACSINELAAISSALRSLPFLLIITKPDSDKVWIASRLLATSLRCPLPAIEGKNVRDLTGITQDSQNALADALRNSTPSKVSFCVHSSDGSLVCRTLSVMSLVTPFGKIGVAIGGDGTTE